MSRAKRKRIAAMKRRRARGWYLVIHHEVKILGGPYEAAAQLNQER
jgi:hypothetical protein